MYEPDENRHEIKIDRFYADIAYPNEHICPEHIAINGLDANNAEKNRTEESFPLFCKIIEVQTGNLYPLNKKLAVFLEKCEVTVVYPIVQKKWLIWVDPETGQTTNRRKSPKTGKVHEIFDELYKIKSFLTHPNLRINIALFDVVEFRNLNGWSRDKKKGSRRLDRVPENLCGILEINKPMDYLYLIPDSLPEIFTVKDYKQATGLSLHTAQDAMKTLHDTGAVIRAGKKGNAYLYKRSESY